MEENKKERRIREKECPPDEKLGKAVDKSQVKPTKTKEKNASFKKKRKRIPRGTDASQGILGEINGEPEK